MDFLLSLPDKEFSQIYAKKFKLYCPFSDALKPLFTAIKEYFENLIKMICEELKIDINMYINKWNIIDKNEGVNTSSIILYQFGKDKEFMNEIMRLTESNKSLINEAKQKILLLINYINNNEKWSYIGWCPHAPDIRIKHLVSFPLDIIFDILEFLNQREYIESQREFISDLRIEEILSDLPKAPSRKTDINKRYNNSKIKKKKITSKTARNKITKMIRKLNKNRNILLEWENYYISFAKTYSILSNNFQK